VCPADTCSAAPERGSGFQSRWAHRPQAYVPALGFNIQASRFTIDYGKPHPGLDAMNPVVASDKLTRTEVWAEDDESVHWAGAFAVHGGHAATASSTIAYEIEAGKRLGWHTDATEETQYIIAGTGELHMEDGNSYSVVPGSVFAIPTT